MKCYDIGMLVEVLVAASHGTSTGFSNIGLTMNNAKNSLSVLFADVSGSARLHEKLGGAETLRAVDRCLKRMGRAVDAFGGRIIKTVGDEMMAVFDMADEAFHAAIEMQQRVADLPPISGVKLAIRVGFSHGTVSEKEGCMVGETVNAAAHLAGLAKPGQVLTSIQAQAALSPALKNSTRELGSAVAKGKSLGMKVFEVVAPVAPGSSVAKTAEIPDERSGDGLAGARFCVRYSGKAIILDDSKLVIKMGRDAESDVVIHDRRASRLHARIELQGNRVILTDMSTNGTFITLSGEQELFLRSEECVLHGKGMICFAASATSPDADCAEFEQL